MNSTVNGRERLEADRRPDDRARLRPGGGNYLRSESRAQQLDRNWAELVQELRVIGTGVQILFAFVFSMAFQARFAQTSPFQRDLYLVTFALSALSVALLIGPVALHRFLFQIGIKDRLVEATNVLVILGVAALLLCMEGAVVLIFDWVGGRLAAILGGIGAFLLFGTGWFALPIWLRYQITTRKGRSTHAATSME